MPGIVISYITTIDILDKDWEILYYKSKIIMQLHHNIYNIHVWLFLLNPIYTPAFLYVIFLVEFQQNIS